MATNWTLAQAKKVITEGTDIAAITDIGRRFPLTALAIAKIGDNEGATTIINALPEHITARKIESVLKDGIADSGANDDDDYDAEDAEHDEKPVKKNAKAKAETDDTADAADAEDPITLYKKCKKAGLKVAPKKSVKYYKDALKKAQEAENEADGDADDWDDVDDEEEKPAKKTGKAAAKKSKAKTEPEPEDEDDDEDEWDI